MSDYPEIVPKNASKARGIDFCGIHDYYYIIRSDLGVYMKCRNFHKGDGITVHPLHEACRWGDHYLGLGNQHDDKYFYIIKGNEYRKVKSMDDDSHGSTASLHSNCQGGSHYYAAHGHFYIMFADRKVFRKVKNLHTDKDAVECNIHEAFQDGIYFWGTTNHVYCLKQPDKWGVQYHRGNSMKTNEDPKTSSVHKSVVNFLPGGLAQTKGKAFGYWDKLKYFENDSTVAVDWERTITETVGFTKSEMSSIEHNWSIEMGAQYNAGDLAAKIAKYQFSLKVQYGGKSINTEQQEWRQTTEKSETIRMHIPPNTKVYVWQYQLGFGEEKNLFCADLVTTQGPNPPQEPPMSIVNDEEE